MTTRHPLLLRAATLAGALALLGAPAQAAKTDAATSDATFSGSLNTFLVSQSWFNNGNIDPTSVAVQAGDFVSMSVSIAPTEMNKMALATAAKLSTGKGVTVAVLDSGFNLAHPAIKAKLTATHWDSYAGDADPTDRGNGIDDNGDGYVDLGVGHGTFVASLIAREAPGAKILCIRVANDEGQGNAITIADGLRHAIDGGAKVINVSFALDTSSLSVSALLSEAESKGITVVCAAGNDGVDSVQYFAKAPTTLAVGTVDGNDRRAAFSNFGSNVDLYAPGVQTLAAYGSPNDARLAYWSGTSFSSGFAAGAAALILQRHPTWSAATVRSALRQSVDPAYDASGIAMSQGRLNLGKAAAK